MTSSTRALCPAALSLGLAALLLAGCGGREAPKQDPKDSAKADAKAADPPKGDAKSAKSAKSEAEEEEAIIQDMRAKLDPADRALVEAQDYCPIHKEQRLGGMGVPLKVMLKDQPVFLCCKGCLGQANREPEKTLAKVQELKAKKAGGKSE